MITPARSRWLKRSLILTVLVAGVGYGWYLNRPGNGGPLYETEKVSRGDITQFVTASGQLNPVTQVDVGSQISGIIEKLFADYNSPVKEGQVIAQIDPAAYEANAIQAEGNLANAKAGLELAQVNARRSEELFKSRLISQAEHDNVNANLHQAEAAVKVSEGALKKARVDLARCTIYSPIDGIVISRDVNVGQTVAASLSAPKLFVIANDLSKMQIEARVSEADIGRVQAGQGVKFTVDAFPGTAFSGQVVQVRNAPTNDQGVVTYSTVIGVNNTNLALKPGMTANVSIILAHREDVLKIPNAAFRFRPPEGVEVKKVEVAQASASEESGKAPADRKSKKDKKKAGTSVHRLADGALQSLNVRTGITDGRETEVIEGLKEGDAVVVDMSKSEEKPTLMSRLLAAIRRQGN